MEALGAAIGTVMVFLFLLEMLTGLLSDIVERVGEAHERRTRVSSIEAEAKLRTAEARLLEAKNAQQTDTIKYNS